MAETSAERGPADLARLPRSTRLRCTTPRKVVAVEAAVIAPLRHPAEAEHLTVAEPAAEASTVSNTRDPIAHVNNDLPSAR